MVRRLVIGESQAQIADWLAREFPSESPQTRFAALNRGVAAHNLATSNIAGNNPNQLLGAGLAIGQAPGVTGYRYTLRVFFEGAPGQGSVRNFTYFSPVPLTFGQLEQQVGGIASVVFGPTTAPAERYEVGQGQTFSGVVVDAVLRANS